jgi:hypothetical protein
MNARDLAVHNEGIVNLRALKPELLPTTDSTKWTHYDRLRGCFVRQKTERWPFKNIFIETHSSIGDNIPGGPWQAYWDGCKDLYHYFPKSGKLMWIALNDSTLAALGILIGNNPHRRKDIDNVDYITLGYALPVGEVIKALGDNCRVWDVPKK